MSGLRALVVAESGYGTTMEIARHIGTSLESAGHVVDVFPVGEVDRDIDVAEYDLVVVGGAIRYDRWMAGATTFVRTHRSELATARLGFFFTCLALSKPSPRSTRTADQYESKIRAIAPELEPATVGRFAGAVVPSRMNPVLRTAARAFLALRGTSADDHRNWTEIDAWTHQLLTPSAAP